MVSWAAGSPVYGGSIEMSLGHDIECPALKAEDHQAIRAALDMRGFSGVDLPHPNSPIDFSNLDFSGLTCFIGFAFGGETRFDNVRFSGGIALFNEATFAGSVTFEGTKFCGDALFMNAEFANGVKFDGTTFQASTIFSSARWFNNTTFTNATFHDDVRFNSAKFKHAVHFVDTIFSKEADFHGAEFRGPTHFQGARFETRVPSFFDSVLFEYTDWHGSDWPDVPGNADEAREQVQYYQRLVVLMNQLQKPVDQHFFFRKEMRTQRRSEGLTILGVFNWLYGFVCDYGYGLRRISLFWGGHMLLGAFAIWVSKIYDCWGEGPQCSEPRRLAVDFLHASGISFSNAQAPLGLNRGFLQETVKSWSDVPFFNLIGGVQTVLGVIFLFFLLLTIRNRFRMR